jgi:hypothetical protein
MKMEEGSYQDRRTRDDCWARMRDDLKIEGRRKTEEGRYKDRGTKGQDGRRKMEEGRGKLESPERRDERFAGTMKERVEESPVVYRDVRRCTRMRDEH